MNTLFATALLATAASGMVISEFDTQDRVTGEYIVQVHDQMNAGRQVAAFDLVSSMGGRVFDVYEHGFQGFAVSGLTDELAEKLSYEPMVKLVEPNYIQTIQQACDTTTSRNWGLSRVTSSSSVSGTPGSTQFPNSYAQGAPCGADVELFILDTGVRRNHVDFGGQSDIFFGDYVNPSNPFQDDDQGHGTHVASTAGGLVYGVAKCARTRSLKVCNAAGQCPSTATAGALNAVVRELEGTSAPPAGNRKIVVNMSLGGGFSAISNENANAAARAGAIVVVAAGNSNANSCTFSPASAELAYSVMSSDINDNKSSFSNFGSCSQIWAPGSSITAALHTGATDAVRTISGTSMASPHVAGIMANMWGQFPNEGPRQIEARVTAAAAPGRITNGGLGDGPNLLAQDGCIRA